MKKTLSILVALALCSAAFADVTVRRGYVDMRYGQLHYRIAQPDKSTAAKKPPLVYFTQSPYSSVEFGVMLTEMGRDRVVIAVDTPGYGSSDGPMQQPTIEEFEAAVAEGMKNLGFGKRRPIDLIGLHTGAFTAIEMAIREPQMVRRLTLVGVWLVDEPHRLQAIARLPRYRTTDEFFDWFNTARPQLRKRQLGQNISDAQWGEIMADSLRPMTRREFGHDAAFEYEQRLRERIPLIQQPVLLIALNDGIRDETLLSQPLFRNAQLADFPQLQEGAFFNNAPELGRALRSFLDVR